METVLEIYNLPRQKQEEIGSLNRWITSKEIESVVRNLPTNRIPGPDVIIGEFIRISANPLKTLPKKFKGKKYSRINFTRPALYWY